MILICEDPDMICGDPDMVCREGEEENIIDAKKYCSIQYNYIIQLVLYLAKVVPAPPPPPRVDKCVLLAQWIKWLTRDRCNPKVPSSIPAGGKDFPWARKFNHIALCLGGHIKVRVPGATIARKNTCVIITPQYYALK